MNILFFLVSFIIARAVLTPNPETDSSGMSNGGSDDVIDPTKQEKGVSSERGEAMKGGQRRKRAKKSKRKSPRYLPGMFSLLS